MIISTTQFESHSSRIIVALDGLTMREASQLAAELSPHVAGGKANDLIDEVGASALGNVFRIRFADPKIHDIAATTRNRAQKYRGHADIVTFHATASMNALVAAAETGEECGFSATGVTVLTDIDTDECISIFGEKADEKVPQFTKRARQARMHGIVCSPQETKLVRSLFSGLIINPGVRSKDADTHDQKRVDTPGNAIRNGADLLVCGRQILGKDTAEGRLAEIRRINEEVQQALSERG